MSPKFVTTSAWWLDTSPQACWPLIADARHWSRWWHGISAVRPWQRTIERPGHLRMWRALLGLPLELQVFRRTSQPCQLVEWQIRGDMHARLTWVLSMAPQGGCDVTCRLEFEPMFARRQWLSSLTCLLLESSQFARMRACARDMSIALRCDSTRLREWSGRTRR
jgi:hypothetical protein